MNILVIGGNRFFGKKLVRKLLNDSHAVTLLNRQNLDDGFGSQVSRIKCDRKNSAAFESAVRAAHWDIVYDQVCYEASEAEAACEIFRDRVSHYIFTSSQSVYDPGEWLKEIDFDPYNYKFTTEANSKTHYAVAKRQCEAVFFKQRNFPVAAVRFTFVVGEDDYTGRLKWHVDRVKTGQEIYFPNSDAKIPLIHSDDAAETLYSLGKLRKAGPFNSCAPKPIALSELIEKIEQILGKKSRLARESSENNQSPYGVEHHWYMSIDRLRSIGVQSREIESWLPQLLSHLSHP